MERNRQVCENLGSEYTRQWEEQVERSQHTQGTGKKKMLLRLGKVIDGGNCGQLEQSDR